MYIHLIYVALLFFQTLNQVDLKVIIKFISIFVNLQMSIKQQIQNGFKKAWTFTQTNTKKIITKISQNQKVETVVSKTSNFYSNNKQICIGVGIVIVAWFLIRRVRRNRDKTPQKQPEIKTQQPIKNQNEAVQKQQKKKQNNIAPHSNKKFMDEDDVQFFIDEPSTDIINRQRILKKKQKNNEYSSEDEKKDRLFFQMYNTYKKTEEDVPK